MKTSLFFPIRGILSMLLLMVSSLTVSAQQRGTISGRILADDGAPLSGITVMLSPHSGSSATRSYKTTLTDDEGNFQFANLPQRAYSINVVESRGYIQAPRLANQPQPVYRIGETATIRLIWGGVITGRVSYANGDPIIGVNVTAFRVRDSEGAPVRVQNYYRMRMSDDRGVYRIYGLPPGSYVVAVNHSGFSFYGNQSPFDGDAPTYYPASPRDTAVEIQVTAGAETSGIDIRHRSERGHVISGKVIGGSESTGPVIQLTNIVLLSYPGGMQAGIAVSRPGDAENGFAFLGIPDGEYELIADRGSDDNSARSEPRRVTVRGSDVTGIELRLLPTASIAGRIVAESSPNICDPKAKATLQEVTFFARREDKPTDSAVQLIRYNQIFAPNEQGEFKVTTLSATRYRLESSLPTENWFVKSITLPNATGAATTSAAVTDLGRSGIALKSGERLTGVTVTIADGAASLRGKIIQAKDGASKDSGKLPARLRVHMVPAEPTAAEDVLRYGEALTSDGSFAFTNFAPGKYWLLVKPVADTEPTDRLPSPMAWDAVERARLRKAAEAAKIELELKPCQRVKDYVLRH